MINNTKNIRSGHLGGVRKFLGSIYILAIVGLSTLYTSAQSQNRISYSDTGIKVIPRSDRGADNGRLLYDNKGYDTLKKKRGNGTLKPTTSGAVAKKSNSQIADERVTNRYPEEYKVDTYIGKVDDKDLFWPIGIKSKKTKIIIHHTAGELQEGASESTVLDKLVDILKFHTFTRGRGDIGYNFLIGPIGQIYEGRAGGIDAIGANATFNNTESVGISVMGNYNLNAPTPEQYMSLIKLVISAIKKYNINVYDRKIYHKAGKDYPYVIDTEHDSIIGHTDAGNTSCPGKYIYEDMDYIKFAVNHGIGEYDIMPSTEYILSKDNQTIPLQISNLNKYNNKFETRVKNSNGLSCRSDDSKIEASCDINNGWINMNIRNNGYNLNSLYNIKVSNNQGERYNIYMRLSGYFDSQSQYTKIQSVYENKFGKVKLGGDYQKINYKIPQNEISNLISQNISVMLYDLTTSYNLYNIKCKDGCSVDIYNEGIKTTRSNMSIFDFDTKSSDKINIYYNEQTYKADNIVINPSSTTQFTNYNRNSSSKTPRNIFSGQIIVKKQDIRKLDGNWYNIWTIINNLPIHDYIGGIAESNDNEPYEKVKMMTILTKQYAMYYMNHKNEHLYISSGSDFVITDDPRISQKYIGAGFVSKKWKQAMDETRNQIVIYDNYLPVLPYFSCSAGFTWGASKFGRSDTPYLIGKLDPRGYCDDGKGNFAGHGVGVSGKGANIMAKKGYNYKQILQYYYDNVTIANIDGVNSYTLPQNNNIKTEDIKIPVKKMEIEGGSKTNNIINTGKNIVNSGSSVKINSGSKISLAINRGNKNGLTIYKDEKTFLPKTQITREQTAKMIVKFAKSLNISLSSDNKKCEFGDNKGFNDSLSAYIYTSCEGNIFKGYTKNKKLVFGYNDKLSYAQALAIIVRITDGIQSEKGEKRYSEYISINKKRSYINTSNIKDRNANISRGEFITRLYDTSKNYK